MEDAMISIEERIKRTNAIMNFLNVIIKYDVASKTSKMRFNTNNMFELLDGNHDLEMLKENIMNNEIDLLNTTFHEILEELRHNIEYLSTVSISGLTMETLERASLLLKYLNQNLLIGDLINKAIFMLPTSYAIELGNGLTEKEYKDKILYRNYRGKSIL